MAFFLGIGFGRSARLSQVSLRELYLKSLGFTADQIAAGRSGYSDGSQFTDGTGFKLPEVPDGWTP
ncbi:MAG: hypothetical protein AAGM84_05660 [Pseudomonadota bacterium]